MRAPLIAACLAICIVVTASYVSLPPRFTCIGDCVLTRVEFCIETSNPLCILSEATRRYLDGTTAQENEKIDTSDIARAVVGSIGGEQFIVALPTIVGPREMRRISPRMHELLDSIAAVYNERRNSSQLDAFIQRSAQTFGVSPRVPRPSNSEHASHNVEANIGSAIAGELVTVKYEHSDYAKKRSDEVYPSDLVFPSEAQCTSVGPAGLIGLAPTDIGVKELESLKGLVSEGGDHALRSVLSRSDPGEQLVLFASMPRAYREDAGVRSALRNIGPALASRIAELAKRGRSQLIARGRPNYDELFKLSPAELSAALRSFGGIGADYQQLKLDIALYINWILMMLEDGEMPSAVRAAANVYDLILGMDKWVTVDDLDFRAMDGRADFVSAIRYEPLLSLSYILASHGSHGVALAYVASLDFQEVRLKAAMAACVFRGLVHNKQYVESIELLSALSPSTLAVLDVLNFDVRSALEDRRCQKNPVFGATCQVFILLKQKAGGDFIELNGSLRFRPLPEDATSFFEHLDDLFSRSLAADERLEDHWSQIVSYIRDRLGADAARLADLRKKIVLRQYEGVLLSDDRRDEMEVAEAWSGKSSSLCRGRLQSPRIAGSGQLQTSVHGRFRCWLFEGWRWPCQRREPDDEHRCLRSPGRRRPMACRYHCAEEQLSVCLFGRKYNHFCFEAALHFGKYSRGHCVAGEHLGYSRDGDEQRRAMVAAELVRRQMTKELLKVVSSAKMQLANPLKLALDLVPVYFEKAASMN
jgi:hypothetical protein